MDAAARRAAILSVLERTDHPVSAAALARERGMESIRIDTHAGNLPMQRALEKSGFSRCGTIYLKGGAEDGDARIAFEKIL